MVKSEWSVVQCTTCEKLNRIPGDEKLPDNIIKLNDNLNHFDLKVPYVYGILTCPFCQTENKFRREADHVVCFKCHNSFTLEESNRNNVSALNDIQVSLSSSVSNPSNKVMRYSDFLSPDPMYFRGYYPQPYFFNQCDCSGTEIILKKLLKTLNKPIQKPKPVRRPDAYGPLRQLVRDIDDINQRSIFMKKQNYHFINSNIRDFESKSLENSKNNIYQEVNNNRFNISSNYSSLKNDAVYKKLFNSNFNNRYLN